MIDLLFAILALPHLVREESRDHAFGDVEVYVMFGEQEVGFGYFGGGTSGMTIYNINLVGNPARLARAAIPLGAVGRNDSTGPDEFTLGQTMSGLTKEAVLEELTTPR